MSEQTCFYPEPPSRDVLMQWLQSNGVHVHPALKIMDMDEGVGWMVEAAGRIPEGDICNASKPSLLSPRTSTLYPLLPTSLTHPPSSSTASSVATSTNHAILVFALCILHELRLGEGSRWYGYLQSLPRPATLKGLLPVFWPLGDEEGGSEDAREGYQWLEGTDAWGDLKRREREGMGLRDIQAFWTATSHLLPAVPFRLAAPTFADFTYSYSLLSTRAFIIDIYHYTALIPFADIFNHSAFPHTSLASDEFVCHVCGSMPLCTHDAVDMDRVPARLAHVHPQARDKLVKGEEADTVEMRAEREIGRNQEVFNTYGDHMGDGRLAVEYGFIGEEYAGEGLRMEVKEVDDGDIVSLWHGVLRHLEKEEIETTAEGDGKSNNLTNAFEALRMNGQDETEEGDDSLLYHPTTFTTPPIDGTSSDSSSTRPSGPPEEGLYLSHAGQVSFPLFALLALSHLEKRQNSRLQNPVEGNENVSSYAERIRQAAEGLEKRYDAIRDIADDDEDDHTSEPNIAKPAISSNLLTETVSPDVKRDMIIIARAVQQLLQLRLTSLYQPEADLSELFETRDTLGDDRPRTRLAMTLSINERVLLITAAHKWAEVIEAIS